MSKGSVMDVLVWGIGALTLGIGIIVAYLLITSIQTNTASTLPSTAAQYALSQGASAVSTFDYGFIIIAVGTLVSSVMFAWLVPSHPIFIVISVMMGVIFMVILPAFSNAFEMVESSSSLSSPASSFPLMNFIMGNMPIWGAVMLTLIIIVMYTRYQNSGSA